MHRFPGLRIAFGLALGLMASAIFGQRVAGGGGTPVTVGLAMVGVLGGLLWRPSRPWTLLALAGWLVAPPDGPSHRLPDHRFEECILWLGGEGRRAVTFHRRGEFYLTDNVAARGLVEGAIVRVEGQQLGRHGPRWFNEGLKSPGWAERVALRGRLPSVRTRSVKPACSGAHRPPLRFRVNLWLRGALGQEPTGLSKALLMADRSQLDPHFVGRVRAAGLAHILALSGMHIAMLTGVLTAMLGRLGPRLSFATLLIVLGLFPSIVGPAPAVVRATVAGGAWAIARLLGRRASGLNALGVGAVVILLLRPEDVSTAGFQLSFAATAAILLVGPPSRAIRSGGSKAMMGLRSGVRMGIAAHLGTAALVLYHFERLPIWGPLLSLGAVPLAGASLLATLCALPCLALGGEFPLGALRVVAWCSFGLDQLSRTVDRFPFSAIESLPLSPAVAALASAVGLSICGVWGGGAEARGWYRAVQVGVLGLAIRLAGERGPWDSTSPNSLLRPGTGESAGVVLIADVGQGSAAWVGFSALGGLFLDSGPPGFGARNPWVERAIHRAVPALDPEILILSHPHADHDGGASQLLELHPKLMVLEGAGAGSSRRLNGLRPSARVDQLFAGERVEIAGREGGWWATRGIDSMSASLNDGSVVTRIWLGGFAALFPGDLEEAGERALIATGLDLRADLLVLAHHGSDTSTREPLLDAVQPRLVVVSTGRGNRYGHPSSITLARVRERRIPILRTDMHGSILVQVVGDRWTVKTSMGRAWNGIGYSPVSVSSRSSAPNAAR